MTENAELSEAGEKPPALVVHNLRRPGIGPVHLSVGAGECVALSGPSGAGKSLLLRAIADLDPNDGDVRLDSVSRQTIPAPGWRRRVIYVPAESGWWAQDVAPHFDNPDAAADILEDLALPRDSLHWPVGRLSTGERQRLALVRALALTPRVLLLDEPTSGLDPDSTSRVEDMLSRALTRGMAILMVTHDRRQAERMAHRHLHMKRGRLTPGSDGCGNGGGGGTAGAAP